MATYLSAAIAWAIAFMVGSIPTAYLIGRWLKGIDIRQYGSGNVGATNAFRVLGKGWGIGCLLADIAKGYLPTRWLLGEVFAPVGMPLDGWMWTVGLAAILGHMFSPFLGFRGGKGVATSLGVLLAIAPVPVLIVLAAGLLIIWLTGYVSAASIAGAAALPFLILIFQWRSQPWVSFVMTLALGTVIILKHRPNIARLRAGTEKRIFERTRPDQNSGEDRPS